MVTKITVMAVLACVAGCRNAGPTGPLLPEAGTYLPLAAGNIWEYDLTTSSAGFDTTFPMWVILDSGQILEGRRWYRTIDICPEFLRPTPLWCGMFSHQFNRTLARRMGRLGYTEPYVILDIPLIVGKQWTIEDRDTAYTLPDGSHYFSSRSSKRYVRAFETIVVPAGTFYCYRIEDSTSYFHRIVSPGGDTSRSSYREHAIEWFAQGIGLVKQIANYSWNNDYGYRETYALRRYNVRLTD